jgi:hypothetical protein
VTEVPNLKIPALLDELIASGRWPSNIDEAQEPILPFDRIRSFARRHEALYLYPPPFRTIRQAGKDDGFWNSELAVPEDVDFGLAIPIGDFGIGADAPLLLDYREDLDNPKVIRLWYGDVLPPRWIEIAPTFRQFVELLDGEGWSSRGA